MAQPGTKSPPNKFPKAGGTCTALPQAEGSKQIKAQSLRIDQPADIGEAPTSRVYTRDYSKVGRAPGDTDLITVALGNPLGL